MGPEAVGVGVRRATSAQWVASTLVMQEGEQGLDTDTGEVKYGDGVHTWSALPLFGDADGGNGGGGGAPAARVDHGPIADALTITQPGSHELDLTVDATVTVTTPDDVTLWVHGTGQTLTVAGQTFTIDADAVFLIVTSPREVQSAYLAGEGSDEVDPEDPEGTSGWSEWDRHEFTAANGTAVSTLPTAQGRTYSGAINAIIASNKAIPDFVGTSNNGTSTRLTLTPPAAPMVRHTCAYDVTDPQIGYNSYLSVEGRLQTGSIGAWLQASQNSAPTSAAFSYLFTGNSGAPDSHVTLEAGKSLSGHPVTGTCTMELDVTDQEVRYYINDVHIFTIDCSAFTYGGEPNPLVSTSVTVELGNRARLDQHVIEVYS